MAILAFHSIKDRLTPGITNFNPRRFERLLTGLLNEGISFVSTDDYFRRKNKADKVLLTFDDGLLDFYENAFPILKKLEIPAIQFVPTDFIGKRASWDYISSFIRNFHMTEEQIKEISDSNIEIGSHGLSHLAFDILGERLLKIELERSKNIIEELTGKECRYLSYPFGRFNMTIEKQAIECGYQKAFGMRHGRRYQSDFSYPRFAVYSTDNLFSVRQKLSDGVLNNIEKMKLNIINQFSSGTVLLQKIKNS